MSRRRKAWLINGNGRRKDSGRTLPGYYVYWNTYSNTGQRSQHSRQFHRQADARVFCKRHNAKNDLGAIDLVQPILLRDASHEYFDGLAALRPSTIVQYSVAIGLFSDTAGDAYICDIGRNLIDRFIAERLSVSREASVAKHLRSLHRFFNWCIESGYGDKNPVKMATSRPRNTIVRVKPRLTDIQFANLLDQLDTEDRRLAVLIAATTGLDRRVIERITPSDIDLEHRQFHVVRLKTAMPVYPYVHDDIFAAISQRVDQQGPLQPLLRGLARQSRHRDWWHLATTAAGLPTLKFVDLRTYAVNWLRSILGDFEAQKIVGHSSPAVTAKHYYQTNPEAQQLVSARPLPGSQARRETGKTA